MRRSYVSEIQGENLSTPPDIPVLMAGLASEDAVERERAREALVALGKPAVAPLVRALSDQDDQVRWEAANALACLRDPDAASALVAALGDDRMGVRWLAAEGLIALGHDALEPLLKSLLDPRRVDSLGQGAHRVLRVLASKRDGRWLAPLIKAIESHEPSVAVPLAALRALDQLRRMDAQSALRRPTWDSLADAHRVRL